MLCHWIRHYLPDANSFSCLLGHMGTRWMNLNLQPQGSTYSYSNQTFVYFRWSIGYNGSPIFFTNNKTIAHLAGNCIRLFNIESGEEKFIRSPGDGIGVIAVNTSYNLIALSESCIDTNIFIYDLDDTSEPKAVLQGDFIEKKLKKKLCLL